MKSLVFVFSILILLTGCNLERFEAKSSSMEPTIHKGEILKANKEAYRNTAPLRFDIVIFTKPDTKDNWVSRIIGLPGDKLTYGPDKQLVINDEKVSLDSVENRENDTSKNAYKEVFENRDHNILIDTNSPAIMLNGVSRFPSQENCTYVPDGFTCTIPPDHFFVMGDNRDFSQDSRYWGFLPRSNIIGKIEGRN